MKKNLVSSTVISLALVGLWTAHAGADQKGMTKEMKAQMARMKKAGSPGPGHVVLKKFAGQWTTTSRGWMKPGDKPHESKGKSTFNWVLGGRFLKQEYKGNWEGQTFEGIGYIGYDNIKKEYTSVWMDNMSTGIFRSTGQYNATTKTIKDSGTYSCVMTGEKEKWFRTEWKRINNNKHTYTMYSKDASGKEFKSMEMRYTRIK